MIGRGMDLSKNAGVYKIVSLKTGKVYIGSTHNFEYRRKSHFRHLRDNDVSHHNRLLQEEFDKYGEENLVFKPMAVLNGFTRKEIFDIEFHLINELKPELNLNQTGGSSIKPVLRYDLQGNLVKTYPSLKAATLDVGVAYSSIVRALSNSRFRSAGCQWRYKTSSDFPRKIEPFDFTPPPNSGTSKGWSRFWNEGQYTIYRWDLKGNLIDTWEDLRDLVEVLECSTDSLREHIQGRRPSLYNFICTLAPEFPGYKNRRGEYNSRQVVIKDTRTGRLFKFSSFSECDKLFKLKHDCTRGYHARGFMLIQRFEFLYPIQSPPSIGERAKTQRKVVTKELSNELLDSIYSTYGIESFTPVTSEPREESDEPPQSGL